VRLGGFWQGNFGLRATAGGRQWAGPNHFMSTRYRSGRYGGGFAHVLKASVLLWARNARQRNPSAARRAWVRAESRVKRQCFAALTDGRADFELLFHREAVMRGRFGGWMEKKFFPGVKLVALAQATRAKAPFTIRDAHARARWTHRLPDHSIAPRTRGCGKMGARGGQRLVIALVGDSAREDPMANGLVVASAWHFRRRSSPTLHW